MGLNVKNISYCYGKSQVVTDISFKVNEGEIVTLFGPSGVGKTTILKMIAGMLTPQSGTIEYTNGYAPSNTLLVFQDFMLFPHMTVTDNIAFGLKMRHLPKSQIEKRVQEMITEFQLAGLEKQYPAQLSGGQQQRVALARAIILQPKLLLLDEPFSSLDGNLRQQMYGYLRRLRQRYHFSVVMVSHDQQETFSLADRIVVVIDHRVQQVATPQQLYQAPANRLVADFIGAFNYLSGVVTAQTFTIAGEKLPVANEGHLVGKADLLLPYTAKLTLSDTGGLLATVMTVEWQPAGPTIRFKVGDQQLELRQTNFTPPLTVGQKVRLRLPKDLRLLPCR